MKLSEIYSQSLRKKNNNKDYCLTRPVISFEIFPPKGDNVEEKVKQLFENLKILKEFAPELISVTYGAGGTTAESSVQITQKIITELKLTPMPHFTCIKKNKKDVEEYLKIIQQIGIENILALRGDIPLEMNDTCGDFRWASELVEFIKSKTELSIGVAGYPEGHVECKSIKEDIENLKKKTDAGADVIYTQLFFDNTIFKKYTENVRTVGINNPIVAGILPISSYSQLERMLQLCRVTLPNEMSKQLEKYKNSSEDIKQIGIEFAVKQCKELIDYGVQGLHFYCLNKSEPVATILKNIL